MTKQSKSAIQKKSQKKPTADEVQLKYLLRHLNSPLAIYDNRKMKFVYANQHFKELVSLETDNLDILSEIFISGIHPADILVIQNNIYMRLLNVCEEFRKNKKQNELTYEISYRYKNRNGSYLKLMSQNTVLEWEDGYKRSVVITMITDISKYKKDSKLFFSISTLEQGQKWKTIHTEEICNIPTILTKREIEIMLLIVKGESSQEISKKLETNYHTVRTHRARILIKTNCKSQHQLKTLAEEEGWI